MFSRNEDEIQKIKEIAGSDNDHSILMINLNKYVAEAEYPNGKLYKDYMEALSSLLEGLGGKVLWQAPVLGQAVGEQDLDEILGIWYPSHQAFVDLTSQPGSERNFDLRNKSVKNAWIHRCSDNMIPKP